MNDYMVSVKIRQGRILDRMREMGIGNAAELARASGATQSGVGRILNFKMSPKTEAGKWRCVSLKIAEALGTTAEDLFPDHMLHSIDSNERHAFASYKQIAGSVDRVQLPPTDDVMSDEARTVLAEVLDTVAEREKKYLLKYYADGESYQSIAEGDGITRECVRQVICRGLRKLRHPVRADRLRDVCDFAV